MVLVWEGLEQDRAAPLLTDLVQSPQSEHERYIATHVIPDLHGVDPSAGLDPADAERRRLLHGPNVLAGIEPRSAAAIIAGQALTVPNAVLGGAAALSVMLGDVLEAAGAAATGSTSARSAVAATTERMEIERLIRSA